MQLQLKPHKYTDSEYVEGVYLRQPRMQSALYNSCKKYFYQHYRGVFFAREEDLQEIFQYSVLILMQKIERREIYAQDGIVYGKNSAPMTGALFTYLMETAKHKNQEIIRSRKKTDCVTVQIKDVSVLQTDPPDRGWDNPDQSEAVAVCLSKMPERCYQILTLFYKEEKTLDEILILLPTFASKNALKTAKNKCLNKLRESSINVYNIRRRGNLI